MRREPECVLDVFLRQYGRRRQKGREPNDRVYDRKLEAKVLRMRPEDLDDRWRGEDEDRPG